MVTAVFVIMHTPCTTENVRADIKLYFSVWCYQVHMHMEVLSFYGM